MAGLCEGGNEPSGSLKARKEVNDIRPREKSILSRLRTSHNSGMRRERCEARLSQIRTTREIESGFYGYEMRGLKLNHFYALPQSDMQCPT
ncbi:hypothetical protein ANN_08980 [Periplaneta americana]|uniref:Uncharacterized protein n=1 Tax=Periplaneta americana TaxID=6978 RepID=A0ABQ8TLV9_PERAM|nr:hypothetical protein ANN_08980 [Periplaneta americana]